MITHQQIIPLGMFFIILGFFIIFFGSIFLGGKAETKYSVIGFIGPFPIGFGNDKRLMFFSIIFAIIIIVIAQFFFVRSP